MSARWIMLIGALAIAAQGYGAAVEPLPRLIWNASPSVPIGLYGVYTDHPPLVDDLAAVMPPKALGTFMAVRHYLPLGLPLLKHVVAHGGDIICRHQLIITVNGRVAAQALRQDRRGRALPNWQGCHTLRDSEVFLLNPDVADSFDGRYFGVLPATTLLGRATPLLVVGP
jgi:conjugative transfer signal peptidase TraF